MENSISLARAAKEGSYPKAMELIAAYSKQGVPYIVEATQPYLISSISDGHRNDVPAKRVLRITKIDK
jgi:hypothetical protein